MNFLVGLFKTFLPRLLGVAAGLATAKLAEKTGIVVDPASVAAATVLGYATVHRMVSSKLNPGDSATRRMVTAETEAIATGSAIIPEAKR